MDLLHFNYLHRNLTFSLRLQFCRLEIQYAQLAEAGLETLGRPIPIGVQGRSYLLLLCLDGPEAVRCIFSRPLLVNRVTDRNIAAGCIIHHRLPVVGVASHGIVLMVLAFDDTLINIGAIGMDHNALLLRLLWDWFCLKLTHALLLLFRIQKQQRGL